MKFYITWLLTQSSNSNLRITVIFCLKMDPLLLNIQNNGKAAFTEIVGFLPLKLFVFSTVMNKKNPIATYVPFVEILA